MEQECPQLDKDYILGNYKICASNADINLSLRCRYVRAICQMGDSSYDKSRYELSLISADVKSDEFSELNGLSLTSLAEIAFLQGDKKRANTLSSAVNELLMKKLPLSYPYSISELLLIKSCLDSKNISEINKRLDKMKKSNIDSIMLSSMDPWQ